MNIGSTIKRLRRERDMTQEYLAECLGISAKSVSQWECGRTSPDLSQIPVICNLFDVTADTLLGINVEKKAEQLKQLRKEANKLAKNGFIRESWELLHDILRQYPNDYDTMSSIDFTGTMLICGYGLSEEEEKAITEECTHLCERILEGCTDDMLRHNAISSLCGYYADRGDTDKALEMAYKMPILCNSREFILTNIYKGTEYAKSEQSLINTLVQFLANCIDSNYQLDSGERMYSSEEWSALRKKKIALFELLFEDGDYGFYHTTISQTCLFEAYYYAHAEDASNTLSHLSAAADHAIKFLEFMNADEYINTSLLFKNQDCKRQSFSMSHSDNAAAHLLNQMNSPAFDFIRSTKQFDEIRTILIPHAGKNDF